MLYELSNADPSSKSVIYFKNKDIYDILSELEKTGNLKHNEELFKIKDWNRENNWKLVVPCSKWKNIK